MPLFRKTPAVLDFLWDSPAVIRRPRARRLRGPEGPRRADGLDAARRGGLPGQGGPQARRVPGAEPPFDVVVLPMSLLIALAPPLKRALRRPSSARSRATTSSWTACGEPTAAESMALIREARVRRRRLRGHERLLRRLHGRLPRPAATADPHGARSGSTSRATSPAPASRATSRSRSATSRASRREGAAPAGRGLRHPAPRAGAASRAAGGRGLPRARAPGLPRRRRARRCADGGLDGRVPLPRDAGPRGEDRVPARASTCSRCPSPYAEPKGLYLLEAMANGVPGSAAPRGLPGDPSRRRAAACSSSPTTPATWPRSSLELASDPRAGGRAGPAGRRRGARATTPRRAWPSARSRSTSASRTRVRRSAPAVA